MRPAITRLPVEGVGTSWPDDQPLQRIAARDQVRLRCNRRNDPGLTSVIGSHGQLVTDSMDAFDPESGDNASARQTACVAVPGESRPPVPSDVWDVTMHDGSKVPA